MKAAVLEHACFRYVINPLNRYSTYSTHLAQMAVVTIYRLVFHEIRCHRALNGSKLLTLHEIIPLFIPRICYLTVIANL